MIHFFLHLFRIYYVLHEYTLHEYTLHEYTLHALEHLASAS